MSSISTDLATGLVSVWLTDSSGLTTDLHGSNTLTNSGVSSTTLVQGDAGDFEASESDYEYITDASQSGLDLTSDMTVALWLRLESQVQTALVSKWNGSGDQRSFFCEYDHPNTELRFWNSDDGTDAGVTSIGISQTLSAATNYHLVWVYDASAGTCQIYVNGSSIGTGSSLNTSTYNSTSSFAIGARYSNAGSPISFTDGIVNQVCVWNTTLTSGNVSTLYNSGSGIPYEASGPANLKTRDTIAKANIKTIDGIAIANVKTIDTIT